MAILPMYYDAPETLYSEATQEPLPQWVEKPGLKRTA